MSKAGSERKLSMMTTSLPGFVPLTRSASPLWHTIRSVASGTWSTAQFLTLTSSPANEVRLRNLVAPSALDPIPASQANIMRFTNPTLLSSIFRSASGAFSSVLMNGMHTTKDTAAAISIPPSIMRVSPFGAITGNVMKFPGEAGATRPASVT